MMSLSTRSALVAAVLTALSASQVLGAPTASCPILRGSYGQLQFGNNVAISNTNGALTIGDKPQQFALATCGQGHNEDPKGYTIDYEGYVVDSYDVSSCVTASTLDSSATFSMQTCQFDSSGNISPKQAFAWRLPYTTTYSTLPILFAGDTQGYLNQTHGTPYSFAAGSSSDDQLADLTVQYNPDNTTSGSGLVFLGGQEAPAAQISCAPIRTGQLNFSNATYTGPLNKLFEAQQDTTDGYTFEQCESTSRGFVSTDTKKYGRLRPTSDNTTKQYTCYGITQGPSYDQTTLAPTDDEWVYGFDQVKCSDEEDYHLQEQFFELDTDSNELTFLYFNATQSPPGVFYWYTQLDYDREANITQYVWDPHGVGTVYLDPNSDFIQANPPAKITFA